MALEELTTAHLDYLQRTGFEPPALTTDATLTFAPDESRCLRGVAGVAKLAALPREVREDSFRIVTEDLLVGLYNYEVPLAFVIGARDGHTVVGLGTWLPEEMRNGTLGENDEVMQTGLRAAYPSLSVVDLDPLSMDWQLGGLVLGVPTAKPPDAPGDGVPHDRLLRAMAGGSWAALVLAQPVNEASIRDLRLHVLNELRSAATASKAGATSGALAEHYSELLSASLTNLTQGHALGAWRTGVYLLGDSDSYYRLASVWRGLFAGRQSVPEPIRVWDRNYVPALATQWALPDPLEAPAPGLFRHPFTHQTLLTSPQLAAYVHLPECETSGFSVTRVAEFDVVPPPPRGKHQLKIGKVLDRGRVTQSDFELDLARLTRHTFIAGVTGSGKTNTIMSLLREAAVQEVPFLVLEPTKTEYRALINDPALGPATRVFTAGKATISPFIVNPFEVLPGITVAEHLDLLRAAFAASFGMWTPLPQILERCLHEIYIDRGWDLRTNTNKRLAEEDDKAETFPTLSDLIAKSDEVISTLGYEEKVTGDLRAALMTRLSSLRHGAKGAMLDVNRSMPPEELFEYPTIIELETLGDAGDKAFFTALLLIRLAEYRRSRGYSTELAHLLVVEEAHRLLSNVPTNASEEVANPRGEAVETFSNLLSEIRAYGQGVIIADQVPVRLAPDVMKNTNLKIAHRIVSTDDRVALAGAMAMDEYQAKALASLEIGQAAVFTGGDDAPLLLQVPLVKGPLVLQPPPDSAVEEHMSRWRAAQGLDDVLQPRSYCSETCATPAACDAARTLASDEYVQRALSRTVLATVDEPGSLDRLWGDLTAVVRARQPVDVAERDLLRAFAGHGSDWLANRRGAQQSWSYSDTAEYRDRLRAALLAKADDAGDTLERLESLRTSALRLHARQLDPYPACHLVCVQEPPVCLYRSAVADLVASGRYDDTWREADESDANSEEGRRRETWEVCQDAAYEVVEFPNPEIPDEVREQVEMSALRVCLCFEQQMLANDRRKVPRTARRVLARVLDEAGLGGEPSQDSTRGGVTE